MLVVVFFKVLIKKKTLQKEHCSEKKNRYLHCEHKLTKPNKLIRNQLVLC